MTLQITDVSLAGATTITYPARVRERAEDHWKYVIADPYTLYAQWVENGAVVRRFIPAPAENPNAWVASYAYHRSDGTGKGHAVTFHPTAEAAYEAILERLVADRFTAQYDKTMYPETAVNTIIRAANKQGHHVSAFVRWTPTSEQASE